ncbi:MAG: hypothetical protein V1866_06310 [archaeon]
MSQDTNADYVAEAAEEQREIAGAVEAQLKFLSGLGKRYHAPEQRTILSTLRVKALGYVFNVNARKALDEVIPMEPAPLELGIPAENVLTGQKTIEGVVLSALDYFARQSACYSDPPRKAADVMANHTMNFIIDGTKRAVMESHFNALKANYADKINAGVYNGIMGM